MKNKKGIMPVIAISLILVVTVFAIVNYDKWYDSYLSSDLAKIETSTAMNDPDAIKIDSVIGSTLYVFNNLNNNLEVKELQIGDNTCSIPSNLSKGLNEIDISSCNSGVYGTSKEVKLIAGSNLVTNKIHIRTSRELLTNLCDDMVAQYHFDNNSAYGENNANIYDFSGSGNNLTCTFYPELTLGKYGYAYQYNNNSLFFSSDEDLSSNFPGKSGSVTTQMSFSLWFNYQFLDVDDVLIRKPSIYQIVAFDTDTIEWGHRAGTATYVLADVMPDQWNNLVGVWNGTDMSLYLNGVLADSGERTGVLDTNNYYFLIGGNLATNFFNGKIDEVILWNRSLTFQEVQALYSRTSPLNC